MCARHIVSTIVSIHLTANCMRQQARNDLKLYNIGENLKVDT